MKATEFMVGNWVPINGTPRKIQAVDGVDDEIMADDELYTLAEDRYHSEDRVEGVPITPEILEKNGFQRSLSWHYCNARFEKHEITIQLGYANRIEYVKIVECSGEYYNIPSGNSNVYLPHIKYVHELQNALSLCGIEHDIKL